jgi:hypothetical protein
VGPSVEPHPLAAIVNIAGARGQLARNGPMSFGATNSVDRLINPSSACPSDAR